MKKAAHALALHKETDQGTLVSYLLGFLLSVMLTVSAYLIVANHLLRGQAALYVVVFIALLQLAAQLVFFFHLDSLKSRWKLFVFLFMMGVVAILGFGSVWIMNNLNYNMMTPTQLTNFIIQDEGVQK